MIASCFHHLKKSLPFLLTSVALVYFWEVEAGAQGCSMCKTAAEAQPEPATTALSRAILFLLAPPVAIMGTILVYTFRRGSSDQDQ